MQLTLAYHRRSAILSSPFSLAMTLAPNLRRDRVSYEGRLAQPLRFREAVSALHDVVISDLRYKQKDKIAYREYLAERKKEEESLRRVAARQARQELQAQSKVEIPVGLEQRYHKLRSAYWNARQRY